MKNYNFKIGTKEYYEAYAKISLVNVYKECLSESKIMNKESPDIQDEINNIGIEVTGSQTNEMCMANSIANKTFNNNYSLDELKNEAKKISKTFSGEIGNIDDINYISPYKEMIDMEFVLNNIKKAIINKIELFYDHYKHFNENNLYIFTGDATININDIEIIMKDISKINNPFYIIFINCIDKIFVCQSNSVKELLITNNQLKIFKKNALNYFE